MNLKDPKFKTDNTPVKFADFDAYVISLIYDKYVQLFRQKDADNKGVDVSIGLERTVDSIVDSKLHYALVKASNYFRINHINPVYYLSIVFSRHLYNDRNKKRIMNVPYEVGLVSDTYQLYYQNGLKYDRTYHKNINGVPHETVMFLDNPYISFMYQYYGLLQKCRYDNVEMSKGLRTYQYNHSIQIMTLDESKLGGIYREYVEYSRRLVEALNVRHPEMSLYVMQLCNYRYLGAMNTPILLFGTSRYSMSAISDIRSDETDNELYLHSLLYGLKKTYDSVYAATVSDGDELKIIRDNLQTDKVSEYYDIINTGRKIIAYFSSDLVIRTKARKVFPKDLREQLLDKYDMPIINI